MDTTCSRMRLSGFVFLLIFLSGGQSLSNIEGLHVDSVRFNPVCASGTACWEISVKYRLSRGHWNSVYIPKVTPQSGQEDVKKRFDSETFPCNAEQAGVRRSTICCFSDVIADYYALENVVLRLSRTLGDDLASFGETTCLDESSIPSFGGRDGLSLPATEIEGNFLDLTSRIIPTRVVDSELGIYEARLLLDEGELLSKTGTIVEQEGGAYLVETFVGLVDFKPTGTANLNPVHNQVALRLHKTASFVAGQHAPQSSAVVPYEVAASVVEVLQHDDQRSSKRVRYVKFDVTFTGSAFTAGSPNGFVPLNSVSVGASTSPAVLPTDWHSPCADVEPGGLGFSAANDFATASALGQDCAPDDAMCSSQPPLPAAPANAFTLSVPLGDLALCDGCHVHAQFDIEAVDTDGQLRRSSVTAAVSTAPEHVASHCLPTETFAAGPDLKSVARLDLLVGAAASAQDLQELHTFSDLASVSEQGWADPQAIPASSAEDGMLALVLDGDGDFFARNPQAALVLEDLVTVHFMEPAGTTVMFEQVAALVGRQSPGEQATASTGSGKGRAREGSTETPRQELNAAFAVEFDSADNRFHLQPSQALLDVCPTSPKYAPDAVLVDACVTRRDVRYARAVTRPWPGVATAYRMQESEGSGTWNDAEAFMESLGGAPALGKGYAGLLWDDRGLAEQRRRQCWWINAGYQWAEAGGDKRFFLSQRVMLLALFAVDGGAQRGARRSLLASMEGVDSQVRAVTVEFEANANALLAQALAKDGEVPVVATLEVAVALRREEACASLVELELGLRGRLAALLEGASSALQQTQILSMVAHRGEEPCGTRRAGGDAAAGEGFSTASVRAEVMVVFAAVEGAPMFVDLARVRAGEGVLSAEAKSVPPGVQLAEPSSEDEESGPAAIPGAGAPPERQGSSGGTTTVIAAVLSSVTGVALVVIAGVVLWRRRRQQQGAGATGEQAEATSDTETATVHSQGDEELEGNVKDATGFGGMLPSEVSAGTKSGALQRKLEVAATTSALDKGEKGEQPGIWYSTRKSGDSEATRRSGSEVDASSNAV